MKMISLKSRDGFSLIEVMIGISVFAIGVLSIAAMQISAINTDKSSLGISEASAISQSVVEEIIALSYNDPKLNDTDQDGTNQDLNNDGIDDDGGNFGLDDTSGADMTLPQYTGSTGVKYTTVYNIAVNHPIQNTKTIRVITTWTEKGMSTSRRVTMDYIKFNKI